MNSIVIKVLTVTLIGMHSYQSMTMLRASDKTIFANRVDQFFIFMEYNVPFWNDFWGEKMDGFR